MTRPNNRQNGFTIVELIVVVIVIGLLAMITVVGYRGLQRRANEAASTTAIESANKKLDAYKVANRFYPNSLSDAEVQGYANTSFQYYLRGDSLYYCLTATTSNASMFGNSTDSQPAKGGCPGHAVDGVQPITNYVYNPSVEAGLTNGWSFVPATGYAGAVSSTKAYHGTQSAAITVSTATVSDSYVKAMVSVPGAGTYNVSAYVFLTSGNNGYATGGTCPTGNNNDAKWYNGSSWTSVCYVRTNTTGWQKVSAALTAAGATTFELRFYPPVAKSATPTLFVDGLMVTNGTTNYADGSSSGWIWSGNANNSTSSGQAK